MIRFLRQNTELITGVCVALSLLLGGGLIYIKSHLHMDTPDAIVVKHKTSGATVTPGVMVEVPPAGEAVGPAGTADSAAPANAVGSAER